MFLGAGDTGSDSGASSDDDDASAGATSDHELDTIHERFVYPGLRTDIECDDHVAATPIRNRRSKGLLRADVVHREPLANRGDRGTSSSPIRPHNILAELRDVVVGSEKVRFVPLNSPELTGVSRADHDRFNKLDQMLMPSPLMDQPDASSPSSDDRLSVFSDNEPQLMSVGHKKRAKLSGLKIGDLVFVVAGDEDERPWWLCELLSWDKKSSSGEAKWYDNADRALNGSYRKHWVDKTDNANIYSDKKPPHSKPETSTIDPTMLVYWGPKEKILTRKSHKVRAHIKKRAEERWAENFGP